MPQTPEFTPFGENTVAFEPTEEVPAHVALQAFVEGPPLVPVKPTFFKKAACLGLTHKMFPQHHKDITYIIEAREICSNCNVREQCLAYALEFPPADMHGVWAGLTSRQLAAEQKKRGIKAVRPTLAQMWGDR